MSAERTAALVFPSSSEDLDAAFGNAIAAQAMQRTHPDKTDYWGRFEYLAFDAEAGADVFWNALSGRFLQVPNTEVEI